MVKIVVVLPRLGRKESYVKSAKRKVIQLVIVGGAMVMTMMMITRHHRITKVPMA